ncbi:tRNA (adenosine(37)-N6)-dimethylallyltransferase MiaA [Fluviicola sp.]|jgi:tRNA dimethylallyltransferase|uniref:tRNA (adenosine(37)-N6)-dimethylallyltransferase MiaA n=1 Tax=Fluviicola sp. TaxID=1917219 RepID=UPI00282D677E|nr:tRNA (adenosine(37)-N6)-dimethylallyltransferase MiaA [Fluviicola sp.]MDR0801955.1 tRNA (adenosine(37)-N6)-dimethylallyltransferase MiaA [Fluviicola sp.]
MQQLIVIEGPTASGKTALAVALAKALNTVVLSADSRQFYKELAIGTAKPTQEEMQGIPHYFINSHPVSEPVTAARFEAEAMHLIQNDLSEYPQLILVGGSGLFIDALCTGLDPIPADAEIQLKLRSELEKKGMEPLLAELQEKDPVFFGQVDQQNPVRILRALEVIRLTGKTFSEWRKNKGAERPFKVIRFAINHPREILYDRINQRVDLMIEKGLAEEVRNVENYRHLTTLQTVGYKEVFDFFDGKYSLEVCIDKIRQHTRNYAKRQLTWFRKHPETIWLEAKSTSEMCADILQFIQK